MEDSNYGKQRAFGSLHDVLPSLKDVVPATADLVVKEIFDKKKEAVRV